MSAATKALDELDQSGIASGYQYQIDLIRSALEAAQQQASPAHPAAREAVKYLLMRIQTDPNVGYYCGFGTQVFYLLCKAEAELDERQLADVEATRRANLIPAHRQQEPDVELLRRRIEELRQ